MVQSLIDFFVFWDENENPILWLKKLPYDDVKEKGSVFKLGEKTVQVLEVEDSGCPIISPDETNVAFFSGNSIFSLFPNALVIKSVIIIPGLNLPMIIFVFLSLFLF